VFTSCAPVHGLARSHVISRLRAQVYTPSRTFHSQHSTHPHHQFPLFTSPCHNRLTFVSLYNNNLSALGVLFFAPTHHHLNQPPSHSPSHRILQQSTRPTNLASTLCSTPTAVNLADSTRKNAPASVPFARIARKGEGRARTRGRP
jgi:hypothetical protein